ncbi:MAG TPA: DinB family protein [bacterium]|nr:DinB family protein [bacterium]
MTPEESAWRPTAEQKTIGEIARHMAYWKEAVRARLSGQPWTYSDEANWRAVPPTAAGWDEARAELERSHQELLAVLRTLTVERLGEPLGKAWWQEDRPARVVDWAVGVAHHDSYHAAQIFVLRRLYQHR